MKQYAPQAAEEHTEQTAGAAVRPDARPIRRAVQCAALIGVMVLLQQLQLELSCVYPSYLFQRKIIYLFLNCGLVLTVDMFLFLLTMRWHAAFWIGDVFFCFWGIANYYTVLFRGEPITLGLLSSFTTALNVLGSYHFSLLHGPVIFSLCVLAVNAVLAWLVKRLYPGVQRFSLRRFGCTLASLAILIGCAVGAFWGLDRFDPLNGWFHFRYYAGLQGYPVYVIRQALLMTDAVRMPEGYSSEAVAGLDPGPVQDDRPDVLPDIILILNESFYDLDVYTDIDTDVPCLSNWHSMDNAIQGHTVVPSIGGGTNSTEYELLTSNSLMLLNANSPFNYLSLAGANSLVSYLEELGYSTMALHQAAPSNYYRSHAYPALGFDTSYFIDDFPELDTYGKRWATDRSNYEALLDWYQQEPEGPRFMYLLTYQNHGGYEQNDVSYDTVHTRRDFGDLTDDVDEYLTSVRMSDEALAAFLAQVDELDRPVIVCMLGDHAPNFVTLLPDDGNAAGLPSDLVLRGTPFMLWANAAFGHVQAQDAGYVSTVDLAPMLLRLAGLPMTSYYQTLLDLAGQVPIRMSSGDYYAADGSTGSFTPADSRFALLSRYYYMEYNNLLPADERRQELFCLRPAQ